MAKVRARRVCRNCNRWRVIRVNLSPGQRLKLLVRCNNCTV
ncbi:MAG: hypothetical protein PHU78_00990 [Heliobacteriaceae bacterium]|nr:hypothetical protein [Heliobacteriaceae bacterium]